MFSYIIIKYAGRGQKYWSRKKKKRVSAWTRSKSDGHRVHILSISVAVGSFCRTSLAVTHYIHAYNYTGQKKKPNKHYSCARPSRRIIMQCVFSHNIRRMYSNNNNNSAHENKNKIVDERSRTIIAERGTTAKRGKRSWTEESKRVPNEEHKEATHVAARGGSYNKPPRVYTRAYTYTQARAHARNRFSSL